MSFKIIFSDCKEGKSFGFALKKPKKISVPSPQFFSVRFDFRVYFLIKFCRNFGQALVFQVMGFIIGRPRNKFSQE
ncbi:hypothetical protein A9996_16010 [Gelidibacter algens]|nr:hypothetical protein A9996_19425 [Gelidibacter algens]OBX23461.1 hypothetical protein A9996_16010 [Gelidibacter algens]